MCPAHMHSNSDAGKGSSRRSFAVGAATLLASLPAMLGTATAGDAPPSSPELALQRGGDYSFMIGTIRVTALSDGTVPLDLHKLLIGSTTVHTDALLQEKSRSTSGSSGWASESFLSMPARDSCSALVTGVSFYKVWPLQALSRRKLPTCSSRTCILTIPEACFKVTN